MNTHHCPPPDPVTAVHESGIDESGIDESGIDESGIDESGIDESGIDESGIDVFGPDAPVTARRLVTAGDPGRAGEPPALVAGGRHRDERRRGARRARHRRPRRTRWTVARLVLWAGAVGLVSVLLLALACGPAAALPAHPVMWATVTAPTSDLKAVVDRATQWLVGILATIATFFLTLGGAKYLAAGGDPSEVERAKGALKNAGIGYALAVLAPLILKVLQGILGVPQ